MNVWNIYISEQATITRILFQKYKGIVDAYYQTVESTERDWYEDITVVRQ